MNHADELHSLEAKALGDTEKAKVLLKEIAALSGTIKTLQNEIEHEREQRQEVEARLAELEAQQLQDMWGAPHLQARLSAAAAMSVWLTSDIWLDVVAPHLSSEDVARLSASCRGFRALFSGPRSRFWRGLAARAAAPFPLGPLGAEVDWKRLWGAFHPHAALLARHVAMRNVAAAAARPPGHPEAASFFLYMHWSGARVAAQQRVVRLPVDGMQVDLGRNVVTLAVSFAKDLPLLAFGWQGVNSLVELVMVNRRVAGNRKTLCTFSQYQGTRSSHVSLEGDEKPRPVNVQARPTDVVGEWQSAQLRAYVTTPSKSQYRLLGKYVMDDESYFFNLAAARSAGMTHAESRHFSSSDVDRRLRESVAGIPNIAAGGLRDIWIDVPLMAAASEALQLFPEEEDASSESLDD